MDRELPQIQKLLEVDVRNESEFSDLEMETLQDLCCKTRRWLERSKTAVLAHHAELAKTAVSPPVSQLQLLQRIDLALSRDIEPDLIDSSDSEGVASYFDERICFIDSLDVL